MIDKAIMFATMMHENQKRKGTDIPYIFHPLEAAMIASQIKFDSDLICAAILHDVAEDAHVTYDCLKSIFNERVAELVLFQSEDKSKSWKVRKQHTVDVLMKSTDEDAKIVCLADKLANARSLASDYKELGDALWQRFNVSDKGEQGWYYKSLATSLASLAHHPAYQEFNALVHEIFD